MSDIGTSFYFGCLEVLFTFSSLDSFFSPLIKSRLGTISDGFITLLIASYALEKNLKRSVSVRQKHLKFTPATYRKMPLTVHQQRNIHSIAITTRERERVFDDVYSQMSLQNEWLNLNKTGLYISLNFEHFNIFNPFKYIKIAPLSTGVQP